MAHTVISDMESSAVPLAQNYFRNVNKWDPKAEQMGSSDCSSCFLSHTHVSVCVCVFLTVTAMFACYPLQSLPNQTSQTQLSLSLSLSLSLCVK